MDIRENHFEAEVRRHSSMEVEESDQHLLVQRRSVSNGGRSVSNGGSSISNGSVRHHTLDVSEEDDEDNSLIESNDR